LTGHNDSHPQKLGDPRDLQIQAPMGHRVEADTASWHAHVNLSCAGKLYSAAHTICITGTCWERSRYFVNYDMCAEHQGELQLDGHERDVRLVTAANEERIPA